MAIRVEQADVGRWSLPVIDSHDPVKLQVGNATTL